MFALLDKYTDSEWIEIHPKSNTHHMELHLLKGEYLQNARKS